MCSSKHFVTLWQRPIQTDSVAKHYSAKCMCVMSFVLSTDHLQDFICIIFFEPTAVAIDSHRVRLIGL